MNIEHYKHLFNDRDISNHTYWKDTLHKQLTEIFSNPSHGHFNQWLGVINQLAVLSTNHYRLNQANVEIGTAEDLINLNQQQIEKLLKSLLPWRKGPFNFFGINIDSEWQCNQKWQRAQKFLPELKDKTILDVGCGNGYYMLRMLGDGANSVIGVDPTLIFSAQFYAITQCIKNKLRAHLLPMPFEQLPKEMNQFDAVFSMGVLYHRRDPIEHLQRLFLHTKDSGHLILETLVTNQSGINELIPKERYAGMRNVWSIPCPSLLEHWLEKSGFKNIQLHNIKTTSLSEQRATLWTKNFSLENFLDPNDLNMTIEGYPAPTRAILSAQKY